jgi:hypothetical protein
MFLQPEFGILITTPSVLKLLSLGQQFLFKNELKIKVVSKMEGVFCTETEDKSSKQKIKPIFTGMTSGKNHSTENCQMDASLPLHRTRIRHIR